VNSIRTIRYYESLDLIKSSGRTEGGFRQFSFDVLARLSFIKRAQSLGLSLQEIGDILKVYDQGNLPCDELQEMLQAKVVEIDRQIEQLLTLKTELKGLLQVGTVFQVGMITRFVLSFNQSLIKS
jgi:DNA-binding transcriptional MerR regulator